MSNEGLAERLLDCTDAEIWAREFCDLMYRVEGKRLDEDLVKTWFANALMNGYDRGRSDERRKDVVEKMREVIFQAAGAATSVCLQDNPHYIFPSEHVEEAVNRVCEEFGIPRRLS